LSIADLLSIDRLPNRAIVKLIENRRSEIENGTFCAAVADSLTDQGDT